ncbi:glycosyltransferase [Rhodovulum sulfidophilum]|uniref:glycosyltransferase family protein n=1 Tax=Rhodovulum sulfidophilum TaxID=35806 RepID=UPI001924B7C0|nr:glycosyltransferase [Rhodovulum sulfidophilum]MBL3573627.1 glycosyltransferase [Rhodovulum sulfidophilum]MCE8430134.1 glycosyltransferase [Rhodovulum sulfidophilum]MCF4115994.1 glycosyltransferase [Rhodovulum sulfidophilum]
MNRDVRLCLPCPDPRPGKIWGDWFFAQSLARALERAGRGVRLATAKRRSGGVWMRAVPQRWPWQDEIDLVIRGGKAWPKLGRRPLFIWLISRPDSLTDREISEAEHIFVASELYMAELERRGARAVSFLPQCTDPDLFSPDRAEKTLASEILFVGNRRKSFPRAVVERALATGRSLSVWGRGWHDALPPGTLRGVEIPNAELGRHYASAGVVLNDHHPDMLAHGFVSNRVYDVLASGRPVLTEDMLGLPEDLRPAVFAYSDGTFAERLGTALDDDRQDRSEIAAHVRSRHGFDNRVRSILEVIGHA